MKKHQIQTLTIESILCRLSDYRIGELVLLCLYIMKEIVKYSHIVFFFKFGWLFWNTEKILRVSIEISLTPPGSFFLTLLPDVYVGSNIPRSDMLIKIFFLLFSVQFTDALPNLLRSFIGKTYFGFRGLYTKNNQTWKIACS